MYDSAVPECLSSYNCPRLSAVHNKQTTRKNSTQSITLTTRDLDPAGPRGADFERGPVTGLLRDAGLACAICWMLLATHHIDGSGQHQQTWRATRRFSNPRGLPHHHNLDSCCTCEPTSFLPGAVRECWVGLVWVWVQQIRGL